ncbi:RNA-binding S4 domain-containing protein [Mycoplasma procyoni]|uniref:RNA-binding S4 domain-containing protein n=1 Tax=Mycoplasma procyoni TaxID=568784 RepID=UPI00197C8949|nr:RNA-binding S4 domain-containing protein [Mycoplasma procyoni]MBN3534804.1 RNA-binding S4 domain-containing protein [Mycoplasma procyoni]
MKIEIKGSSIKVSQFLKKLGIIDTGGASKEFLETHKVIINGKVAEGRSTKIHGGDVVWINDSVYHVFSI